MFIEKLEPIDLGEPIYGQTIVGCAPKGAPISQLCLPFYRYFTATRLFFGTIATCGPSRLREFSFSFERIVVGGLVHRANSDRRFKFLQRFLISSQKSQH